jgi:hypothetical protein
MRQRRLLVTMNSVTVNVPNNQPPKGILSNPRVKRGSIMVYRLFDVAEEIELTKVESLLRGFRGQDKFKVPKFIDRALVMSQPPLAFSLGEQILEMDGGEVKAELIAKIRDFGVISLIYNIPIPSGTDWTKLVETAAEIEEGAEIDERAEKFLPQLLDQLRPALVKPTNSKFFEDYVIYFIEEFEDQIKMSDFAKHVDIPALLMAEHEVKLSEASKRSVMENIHQYGEVDLVVLEWNAALVIEPSGARELPDLLEFAVSHLLEMRYYDDLLDTKLKVLYDDIEKKRRRPIWSTRFDQVYEDASARYIEFSEFIERVENSLKVVGDFYLATVYRSATRKFRLVDWQSAVTRKMNILGQVSSLLQGEVNNKRSHWLEIIIILLIAYEIVAAFFKP